MHQQILMAAGGSGGGGGGGGGATFDPLKKGTNALLSAGNTTLKTSSGGTSQALATSGYTVGSYYFEVKHNAAANVRVVGLSRSGGATGLNTDLGQEAGEYGWASFGGSYFAGTAWGVSGPTVGAGDVVGVAVNFSTRRMWISVNGVWITGNPATNTSPIVTYASGLGTMYAAASVTEPVDSLTLRTKAADFSYSIPSGFSEYG